MKKWMILALIAVPALIAAIYIYLFIPDTIIFQRSVMIKINSHALRRVFIDSNNWGRGWPGTDHKTAAPYGTGHAVIFNGNTYSLADRTYSALIIPVSRDRDTIASSSLNLIEMSKDSVKLDWIVVIKVSSNPIRRLGRYLQSKKIRADLPVLLQKMNTYFSQTENVYGISIRQEAIRDTTLLFTYDSCRNYPGVDFIYSMIGRLKKYAVSRQAIITGNPMLNIYTKDSTSYLVKVALPVNKQLPTNGRITYKWMLPNGIILVTDVKGDSKAVNRALEQVENFADDYNRIAPAIPFLSLVTDRTREKDSSKWITRIYYPVME